MIKGIIFDLDGTTLSTLDDIQGSVNIVLNMYGFKSQTMQEVKWHIGRGSRNLIKDSLPEGIDPKLVEFISKEYLKQYSKNYNIKTKPYPGVQGLLNTLEQKGILMAINSNKPDEMCKNLIKEYYPGNNFMAIIGSRNNIPNKPDPYSANQIVEMMGFDKSEILYVGDSDNDVNTAHNAGLKCVGCLWGFRDLKTLSDANCDSIISKPDEILNLL